MAKVIYTTYVSTESLDTIRANECESRPEQLTTQRFRALWNEVERLRTLVDSAEAIFQNCSVTAGYCCCGVDMKVHSDPISCGHAAVDTGEYFTREWLEAKNGK